MSYQDAELDGKFLDGKSSRNIVEIDFSNKRGAAKVRLLVIRPNVLSHPSPALMMLSFDGPDSEKMQLDPENRGMLKSGIPIERIIDDGYAFVYVYHLDLVGHNEIEFRNTIHQLFFGDGQSFPKANEWGCWPPSADQLGKLLIILKLTQL